jgi:hypothetical protein
LKFDVDDRAWNASNFRHGSIPGYVAAVRQNAGKLAMIGETRVLANCGYGSLICQTLNQAEFSAVLIEPTFFQWLAEKKCIELRINRTYSALNASCTAECDEELSR